MFYRLNRAAFVNADGTAAAESVPNVTVRLYVDQGTGADVTTQAVDLQPELAETTPATNQRLLRRLGSDQMRRRVDAATADAELAD